MFFVHKIKVPFGFEAIVNGRIESRKPLRVGTYDQVYFVNFAPLFETISVEVTCAEGLIHKVTVEVKLEISKTNDSFLFAGDSTYSDILRISAKEIFKDQNLQNSIKACIQTFVRNTGFFKLKEQEEVRSSLSQKISNECVKYGLVGEVVSCDVVSVIPEPQLLAQVAARAGIKEKDTEKGKVKEYSDTNLGKIVEYLFEIIKQAELAKNESKKQNAIARADLKIVEQNEENRVAEDQAKLQKEEEKRQKDAQKRNSDIKENGANFEFLYKKKRLEEEKLLVDEEVKILKAKDDLEALKRGKKKLDTNLEIEREKELAKIRSEEKASIFTPLEGLVKKLGEIPAADYKGVQTLITSTGFGGMDSKEFATGLVLGLLSKAAEGIGISSKITESDKKKE